MISMIATMPIASAVKRNTRAARRTKGDGGSSIDRLRAVGVRASQLGEALDDVRLYMATWEGSWPQRGVGRAAATIAAAIAILWSFCHGGPIDLLSSKRISSMLRPRLGWHP